MPFKMTIIEDFSSIFRGTKRLGDAFDDVADSLDDVAREGKDAGGKLERSFSDAFAEVRRDSRRAGDDIGDHVKRGTDRATDGVKDLKQEAAQSAKESAQSFSGSFDDIGDLAQETAAQAFSGFGPLGTAAGLAAAAGFGVLRASLTADAEAMEERIGSMFDNMIESGMNYVSRQFVTDELAKIYSKADDAAISWDDLTRAVEITGLSQATVARAFAGDASAGVELTRALTDAQERLNEKRAAATTQPGDRSAALLGEEVARVDRLSDLWDNAGDAVESARERVDGYREAIGQVPSSIDTEVNANVQLAEANLQSFMRQRRVVTVTPDVTALDRELARPRSIRVGVSTRPGTQVVI